MESFDIVRDYKTCEIVSKMIREKIEDGENIRLYLIPFYNENTHRKYKVASNNDEINEEITKNFKYGYLLELISVLFQRIFTQLVFKEYSENETMISIKLVSQNLECNDDSGLLIHIVEPLILYGARFLAIENIVKPGVVKQIENCSRESLLNTISCLSDEELKKILIEHTPDQLGRSDIDLTEQGIGLKRIKEDESSK